MNDYKELIDKLRKAEAHMERFGIFARAVKRAEIKAVADAIEQLMHERFLIGEILVTESKWEIEPETALEQIRRVLRGE